jgi:hypothetical protein
MRDMALPVSLDAVAGELDILMDDSTAYMNRTTGEMITLSSEDIELVEEDASEDDLADWQRDMLPTIRNVLESEDWVELPSKFDVHEWEIMRQFADSVRSERLAERLHRAIHGRGAFRMFRDVIDDAGVTERWYSFKHEQLRKIAREALEELGIPYA